jgi:hypothetical protein
LFLPVGILYKNKNIPLGGLQKTSPKKIVETFHGTSLQGFQEFLIVIANLTSVSKGQLGNGLYSGKS